MKKGVSPKKKPRVVTGNVVDANVQFTIFYCFSKMGKEGKTENIQETSARRVFCF